jgi:FkbM family methyltransferase
MTLSRPNCQPRLARTPQAQTAFSGRPFVIADIGARGGIEPVWSSLASIAEFIAFEPDAEECARLEAAQGADASQRISYVPRAIGGATGKRILHRTKFPYSSGFFAGNKIWMDRFTYTTLDVVDQIEVDTISLDDFVSDYPRDHIDFIKIDVEGAEHEVLAGAKRMLKSHKVLGIKTELWWDPIVKGQPSFAEIDTLLRESGFRFYDLALHYVYPRSVLAMGRLEGNIRDGRLVDVEPQQQYGQAFTGDALYFRDPVGELREGRSTLAWDTETLLRLCCILDTYDYGDCAIEILEAFRDRELSSLDVDSLIDAAVPSLAGIALSYGDYRNISNQIRAQHNARVFGLDDWRPPPTKYKAPLG